MIIKKKILKYLLESIYCELDGAIDAVNSTKDLSQGADTKCESKWDTRTIEAGYLLGAQRRRVEELKLEITSLKEFHLRVFAKGDDISVGSLVDLTCAELRLRYFLSPVTGGSVQIIDNSRITAISIFSPIGRELLGLNVGDSFEIEVNNVIKEYFIEGVT